MHTCTADRMLDDYDHGRITRRQLVAQLLALGAAAATGSGAALGQDAAEGAPTFQSTGLDHIALSVTDIDRSVQFYQKHLGLRVTSQGRASAFLDTGGGEFLALFRSDTPGMHHYCYSIRDYNPDRAVAKLETAGLTVRRAGNRVYFDDPDGLEVQLAAG